MGCSFVSVEPAFGRGLVYEVSWVERREKAFLAGGPGGPVSAYIGCGPEGRDVLFADAVGATSGNPWLVYAYEGSLVILVSVEDPVVKRQMYRTEAFLDRSVRKLLPVGSELMVVSRETALAWAPSQVLDNMIYVGNTGRCGSTLLHRVLQECQVCSLSEPHWLDQLVFKNETDMFEACAALDFALAKRSEFPDAKYYSLNPKAGGTHLQVYVKDRWPSTRRVFMYRSCAKVVESFGSIFASHMPWYLSAAMFLKWRLTGTSSKDPRLTALSSPIACGFAERWLNGVIGWTQNDDLGLALRLDDFAGPNRDGITKDLLARLGVEGYDEAKALAAFALNSQSGSGMTKSSNQGGSAKFLTPDDLKILAEVQDTLLGTNDRATLVFDYDKAGAPANCNIILHGSLGAPPLPPPDPPAVKPEADA